uniref:Uncharacterized protein n=1 Tax=Siphoviridae sp. ctzm5103 TaxID=2825750 RepID=A0A8S5TT86_9CAUD|nr:MAG TPA: hypothetical protein [Siphoviridae sp. ctzm5103]
MVRFIKKIFFVLILLFPFISCVGTPKKNALDSIINEIKEPAVPPVNIEYKNNSYFVSCSYRGENWIFLNGVEIKNSNGDTKKLLFSKPLRNILDSGTVIETGVFSPAFTDSFEAFLGSGDIYARPLADLKIYDFKKIDIINK